MKYLAVLPIALALRYASAQSVIGVHFIPNSDPATSPPAATASVSDSTSSAPTATQLDVSAYATEAPSTSQDTSYGYTDIMPYSSMVENGYQQMQCGYGYARASNGYCEQQSWYQMEGCYETVIINQKHVCSTVVHYATVECTETVTGMQETATVTQTMYETATATQVREQQVEVTATDVQVTTKVWVSTEIRDSTETIEHTLTSVATLTQEATQLEVSTSMATATVEVTVTNQETAIVTQEQEVAETALSNCLYGCENTYLWNNGYAPNSYTTTGYNSGYAYAAAPSSYGY